MGGRREEEERGDKSRRKKTSRMLAHLWPLPASHCKASCPEIWRDALLRHLWPRTYSAGQGKANAFQCCWPLPASHRKASCPETCRDALPRHLLPRICSARQRNANAWVVFGQVLPNPWHKRKRVPPALVLCLTVQSWSAGDSIAVVAGRRWKSFANPTICPTIFIMRDFQG